MLGIVRPLPSRAVVFFAMPIAECVQDGIQDTFLTVRGKVRAVTLSGPRPHRATIIPGEGMDV